MILAPYGLEAKLSGVTYRSHDPVAKKLVEEWKMFYPLATCEDSIMVRLTYGLKFCNKLPLRFVIL